ncbi:hypothetical protein E2C01_044419 [Portunus trituberculatus]|uniref:Uncharacterized protein n=1 Tax=Portunus trituberculatus TaxID=210409 RepID=A0A5B7FS33_PORTR|nr:hypothetical protein [Portunus trituberculatus]
MMVMVVLVVEQRKGSEAQKCLRIRGSESVMVHMQEGAWHCMTRRSGDDSTGRSRYLGRKGLHGWPDSVVASPNMPKGEATVPLISGREQHSLGGSSRGGTQETLALLRHCPLAVSERRVLGEAGRGVAGWRGHQARRVRAGEGGLSVSRGRSGT